LPMQTGRPAPFHEQAAVLPFPRPPSGGYVGSPATLSHHYPAGEPTHAPQGERCLFLASGPWTGAASGCSVMAGPGGVSPQDRRKAGVPLTEHTDPTQTTDALTTTTEILAALTVEEPHGATADQVARTIGLGLDGAVVQDALEELVTHGLLDRRGLGLGAVYTLSATV